MKYVTILSLYCLIITNNAVADYDTVHLLQGQEAPFTGFLLDPARSQRAQFLQMDLDQAKKVTDLQKQDIDVLNQRINNLSKDNTDLQSQIGTSNYKLYAAFIVGIITTVAVSFAITKTTK